MLNLKQVSPFDGEAPFVEDPDIPRLTHPFVEDDIKVTPWTVRVAQANVDSEFPAYAIPLDQCCTKQAGVEGNTAAQSHQVGAEVSCQKPYITGRVVEVKE